MTARLRPSHPARRPGRLRPLRVLTASTVVAALCVAALTPTPPARADSPDLPPSTDAALADVAEESGIASADVAGSDGERADTAEDPETGGVPPAEAGIATIPESTPSASPASSPEPTPSPEPAPAPPTDSGAAAITVVDEGEVRLVSRLVGGILTQRLETQGRVLDPATTVLTVADAQAWPGAEEGQSRDFWTEISPDRAPVWRTSTPMAPGSPVSLVLDVGSVDPTALYAAPSSFEPPAVWTSLAAAEGPGAAGLLEYGVTDAGTSARAGSDAPVLLTRPTADTETLPVAAVFAAEGRTCLTLASYTQLVDGTSLNHDVTLTFAVGGVDATSVEPCAQPEQIAPHGPDPVPAGSSGVSVIDSGTALLASSFVDGALSLDVVTADRGRLTSYAPSEVVFSVPHRDTRWPAQGMRSSQKELWARQLAEGETAYRTAGTVVPGGGLATFPLERANDLTLDLEARFLDADALSEEFAGVEVSFEKSATTGSGRFFAYQSSSGLLQSADDIGFFDSRPGSPQSPRWADAGNRDWSTAFYTRGKEVQGGTALGTAFTEPGVYCVTLRSSTVLVDGTPSSDRATFTFAVGVDATEVAPCSQETGEPAGAVTVVQDGDVRVTSRVADGDLTQQLVRGDAVLDPARTVFSLPDAEGWPGGAEGQGSAFWDEVAPGRDAVWRSRTPDTPGNAVSLSLDAGGIPVSSLYAPEWAPEQAVVRTWLASISGPPGGLLGYGTTDLGTSARAGDAAPRLRTAVGEEAQPSPVAVAFGAAGRACVTLGSHAQLADGTFVNRDLVLTFAVGVDPAAVEPCAQPVAIAPQGPFPVAADADGTTVLDSGTVLMAPTMQNGALTLNAVTADRGRTTAYDPARVVLSIPNRDSRWAADGSTSADKELWSRYLDEGATAYRTSGRHVPDDRRLGDEQANGLVVDLDGRFVSSDGLRVVEEEGAAVYFDLEGATTAQGDGRFFTYRQPYGRNLTSPDDIGFWDGRAGGERQTLGYAVSTREDWGDPFYTRATEYEGGPALGTVFTDPGVYCVTVRASATRADGTVAEDRATFTFAVGVDASTATPCIPAGGGNPGDGGGDPGGEDPETLDPSVAWLQKGHTDLAVREDGRGGIEFATGDGHSDLGMHALKDAVWVGRGDFVEYTVRQPDTADDRTFIGPPGTRYYGFSAGSEYVGHTLWPGLSMLYLPAGFTQRHATWSLQKVSGPGEAYAWSNTSFLLDSRRSTPVPFSLGRTHRHLNWAFTEPGVYCLAVRADLRAAADESRDLSAAALLTVAVGDVDLSTVQPCDRTTAVPDAPAPVAVALSTAPAVLDGTALSPSLELRRVDGTVDVVASVEEGISARTTFFDPEQTVYSAAKAAETYRFQDRWRTLEWDAGGSDVTVTLGAVEGPGSYSRRGNSTDSQAVQLDSGASPGASAEILWPGSNFPAHHVVTAAGVYCVPFTWSGTLADGTAFRVTKTLTFAAGVDTAGITPCADGGSGTDPGETDPETPDVEWDVPNHTRTESGATIVTAGHVDVAARLDGDRLTTVIADASDASQDETLRAPSETVLQVRPDAQSTVPDDPAYAFLGPAGATTWLLPETEAEGILWPGWSTEAIPAAATAGGVTWTLDRAEGPGEFALYQTPFGGPRVFFDTRDGIGAADTFEIPKNIHAHGTWAFSAEGTYCLGFTRAATLASGQRVTDTFTLAFAVGAVAVTKVDPARCFPAPDGAPTETDTTPIGLDTLTDATRGGVQVLNTDAGVTAGQLLTVQIDRARAGQWVSLWLDDTAWLGWARVGSSGAAQVRLPSDAPIGAHVLVVEERGGALAGWDDLQIVASTAPVDPVDPAPGGSGAWDVANGTVNRAGAVVLNDGHVDVASLVQDGRLVTRIKDSASVAEPVYRDVSRTVLQLKPGARATVPAGDAWRFLGDAGAPFFQVTQTQQSGLVWPGWSTEGIPLSATTGGVTWSLIDVAGPGRFALYETGAFGQPRVLFSTHDGISAADRVTIPKNTHAHGSWAFSAEGNYCLSMQRTAQLSDGRVSSDTFVLAVAVGTADVMSVNPARCGEAVDTGTVEVPVPPREDGPAATPAAQQLAAAACVPSATILSAGHVDYASRIVGGSLQSLIGDDSSGTKVYREPSSTVLWLKPSARVTLPAGYGQVGDAGSTIWQVPQTQNPDLVWLGWNTEALNTGNTVGPVRWTIDRIEGPGRVTVYLSGAFGGVQQTIFSGGGAYDIPLGVHAHANWAFSAEGVYRITSTQTATLADGRVSRDRETLTIVVGDVDPRTAVAQGGGCAPAAGTVFADTALAAVAADQAAAEAADAARRILPGQGSDADAPADPLSALVSGDPVPLLLSILGGLLLVAAAGAATLWWRSRRRGPEAAL